MSVEKRFVQPFERGDWEAPVEFAIPKDVEMLEYIDPDVQQEELTVWSRKEAALRAKNSGANPFAAKTAKVSKHVETAEEIMSAMKPRTYTAAAAVDGDC